jgi:hypothetical protein
MLHKYSCILTINDGNKRLHVDEPESKKPELQMQLESFKVLMLTELHVSQLGDDEHVPHV